MIRFLFVVFAAALLMTPSLAAEVSFERGTEAHIVATTQSPLEKRVVENLSHYLAAVLGKTPKVVRSIKDVPKGKPTIILVKATLPGANPPSIPAGSPESFALWTDSIAGRPVVVAAGTTELGVKRAVQRLVIMSEQKAGGLHLPECRISQSPWIPEREWTICPWVPQHVRGVFGNPYADERMNIWLYSDKQLADYVAMYDWFGYSGSQLMETAYSYAAMGSPEAFQGRQRELARLLKENGQNVSLWVWAAEFNGYGWLDPDVTYTPAPGLTAFDDPKVRRGFEKYYDHYAKLAPDVDRLIGHFYDPGHLENRADAFNYMRLLEQKFRAGNPKIKMSIDAWAAGIDYLEALVDNGFKDYLLLEMSMPHLFKPGAREAYHEKAKQLGLKVGIWGWYTTEYESDQLPSLYVNAQVLKNFYNQMRVGALRIHPASYWSEMEAHHLNNIYTMYAASQLLWNPDRDPHEILGELTGAIWGPENGAKVLAAVELIQDVRSGPTWETYWWTLPDYRLGTSDPKSDLERVERSLAAVKGLGVDPGFVPKVPLPFPPETFTELMVPHLMQIREFALFRIAAADISSRAKSGASKEELTRLLEAAWRPIPEFDTWIGTFGQPEARMQEIIVVKMCEELGIQVSAPSWWQEVEVARLLQKIQNMQRRQREVFTFSPRSVNEFQWNPAKMQKRLDTLVERGAVSETGDNAYQLSSWEHYRNFR